jgi:cysteine synthase A
MQTTDNILDLIGNTPLIRIGNESIYAKAEYLNPGGSVKDRVALSMIENAESSGLITSDSILVEPTSGNTGIGISMVGKIKGYKVQIVMPQNMSEERKRLIKCFGAQLVYTAPEKSIAGAVEKAEEIRQNNHNVYIPNQFTNPANSAVHYQETAHELWHQTTGNISCFIAGVGSGGTLQGIGSFLKEKNSNIKIFAVEPKNVSALLGHEPGLHQIQGIGDGFIPDILDVSLVDDVIEVTDKDAIETTRELSINYGILAGISSGANIWAARIASKMINGNIATILSDRAERYFSTSLF